MWRQRDIISFNSQKILNGAHSIGEGILGFLTMVESNALRVVFKEFWEAGMDFSRMDADSVIKGTLKAWQAAFPAASVVNVWVRADIVDSDFAYCEHGAVLQCH